MITYEELKDARRRTVQYLKKSGIVLSKEEERNIEVLDFGLSQLKKIGLQILVYVNTERYCAKELVLFPHQICAEHRHPPVGDDPGKQETFRVRTGEVFLYLPGKRTKRAHYKLPEDRKNYFTVFKEILLKSGQQFTIMPDTLHWFQAGTKGAIVTEFSSKSRDEFDVFTDPDIERFTKVKK